MKDSSLEPGLLPVFRLFTALQLAFLLLSIVAFTRYEAPKHPVAAMGLMAAVTGLLLVYLSLPGLEGRLGAAYLPAALALTVLTPLAGGWVAAQAGAAQYQALAEELALFELLPLLIISWQYNLRTVILYLAVIGLADFGLATLPLGHDALVGAGLGRAAAGRLAALLAVGYIITRLMKEQRAQRRSLSQANAELAHYAATLEQLTISRERNRMARELHDTVAHTLSGIAVQLEGVRSLWEVDTAAARQLVDKSLAAARSGLNETRRALQALRAMPLEDLGLLLALRSLAETSAARAGLALDLQLPGQLVELPPDVEQGLYRVAQEALENTIRHANARRVSLRLSHTSDNLVLVISDDGRGFDPAAQSAAANRERYGLRGLGERAKMMGGRLDITSQPGQGTTVRLELKR